MLLSLALTPLIHSLVLLSPLLLLLLHHHLYSVSFSFTHSFSCFAPVLFLAAPRIPPIPPPSLPHFTLLLSLAPCSSSLPPLCIPSHLVSFSCSPALCQRMSSTSINLSSCLANNIFMMHNYACASICVNTHNLPSPPPPFCLSCVCFSSSLVLLSLPPSLHPSFLSSPSVSQGAGVDGQ